MPQTSQIIAIDGRPASPAMAAALERIQAAGEREAARKARINADPRVIRLRAMKATRIYEEGMDGAFQLFTDFASGRIARHVRIAHLVRARVGQLDKNRAAIQIGLRGAAKCRSIRHALV